MNVGNNHFSCIFQIWNLGTNVLGQTNKQTDEQTKSDVEVGSPLKNYYSYLYHINLSMLSVRWVIKIDGFNYTSRPAIIQLPSQHGLGHWTWRLTYLEDRKGKFNVLNFRMSVLVDERINSVHCKTDSVSLCSNQDYERKFSVHNAVTHVVNSNKCLRYIRIFCWVWLFDA